MDLVKYSNKLVWDVPRWLLVDMVFSKQRSTPMASFLIILCLVCLVTWVAFSLRIIESDEVGVAKFFGKIDGKMLPAEEIGGRMLPARLSAHILKPGLTFVPLLPGVDIVGVPTAWLEFDYEGTLEHEFRTSDLQLVTAEISGKVRLPYDEGDSIALMIAAGVPFNEEEFQKWAEDEIISGARDIIAEFSHKDIVAAGNLPLIREKMKKFFLAPTGLFAKAGICGNDLDSFEPGKGEVIIRIEQLRLTKQLSEDMAALVGAKYRADAASETARQEAQETAGALTLMINEQIAAAVASGLTITDEDRRQIRKECLNILLRGRAAKVGALKDVRVGSASGGDFAQGSISEFVGSIISAVVASRSDDGKAKDGGKGKGKDGDKRHGPAPTPQVP